MNNQKTFFIFELFSILKYLLLIRTIPAVIGITFTNKVRNVEQKGFNNLTLPNLT
jgi:hypothetical protein